MWTVINENFMVEDKMVYHGEKQRMNDLFDALEFATASTSNLFRGTVTLLDDRNRIISKFIY